jgi:hypothetical protein
MNNAGRPKIYDTDEERKEAKKRQSLECQKRQRRELAQTKQQMKPIQLKLIDYLQNHIIKNEPLLELIYKRLLSHRLELINETLDLSSK